MTTELESCLARVRRGASRASLEGSRSWSRPACAPRRCAAGIPHGGRCRPLHFLAHDAALGRIGTYDATIDGSVLHETAKGSLALAHANVGALLAGHASWVGLSVEARGVADAAEDATEQGALCRRMGASRRPFRSSTFRVERRLGRNSSPHRAVRRGQRARERTSGGLATSRRAPSRSRARRSAPTTAKRGSRQRVCARRSHVGRKATGSRSRPTPAEWWTTGDVRGVVRWRVLAWTRYFGLSGEGAHVLLVARFRAATRSSLALESDFPNATRAGPTSAPISRRATESTPSPRASVTDAPIEPAPVLATAGYSGGVRASVPWTRGSRRRGGVDIDSARWFSRRRRATVESATRADAFDCDSTRLIVLGRDGVDVWATIDLIPRNCNVATP